MNELILPITDSVSIETASSPARLWPFVVDAATPEDSKFTTSSSAPSASLPCCASRLRWSTRSTFTEFDAPRRFTWVTGDVEDPAATWTLLLETSFGGARLTYEDAPRRASAALERDRTRT